MDSYLAFEAVSRFLLLTFLILAVSYFIWHTVRVYGVQHVRTNKFVIFTVTGTVFLCLDLIFYAVYENFYLLSDLAISYSFLYAGLSSVCHFALVYFRSRGLFFSKPSYDKAFQILLVIFAVSIVTTGILAVCEYSNHPWVSLDHLSLMFVKLVVPTSCLMTNRHWYFFAKHSCLVVVELGKISCVRSEFFFNSL